MIKYKPNSNIIVAPIVIKIIVILFSFEKFLSKYEPKYPIKQSIIAVVPTTLPYIKSIIKPQITPNPIPITCVVNNPINKINIIIKFGLIPAIVNTLKIFA